MRKILLVNDCKLESIIMKDKLINMGYEVEISNEYGVFSKVNKFNPEVVIVNFVMKEITGDKLIEKIKIKNHNIVCILSSCDRINLKDFKGKGVDEVINTPIEEKELSMLINKAILKYQVKDADSEDNRIDHKENNKIEHNNVVAILKKVILFCPYCGGKLKNGSNSFVFCPYCGEKI
ncbi:response regulator [Clostridium kluyveri]|uniref:Stage 0 sporulation protein A homolog n=2 Tax=Clostridium kluyveri TaxID=1534 RepID=A5N5C4_CLOK5|nr:response regulator [Clostridium kluyveri]EDK32505.1 Predicted response regulator [Clostridium kluyveri DSM 555]